VNTRRRNCKLDFYRLAGTVGANGRTTTSRTLVAQALPCLVEGLRSRTRTSLVGRIDQAAYTCSWSGQQLRDGDLTTYQGGEYVLREIVDDSSTRPSRKYFTAYLQEKK
jgi:hypothetical protein